MVNAHYSDSEGSSDLSMEMGTPPLVHAIGYDSSNSQLSPINVRDATWAQAPRTPVRRAASPAFASLHHAVITPIGFTPEQQSSDPRRRHYDSLFITDRLHQMNYALAHLHSSDSDTEHEISNSSSYYLDTSGDSSFLDSSF